ncbi:putative ABC transport system permease protein [Granulicatella balaenopterae]|uniref:Putative hemin transport system permease protein HrtB n=1 Tax=Granulicatella balaenopterae TaxID=137733 RepID=A0A1H9MC87_9LACT|nr:ABC transporter permease [Granulicatella balaenopterae]SER21294.1 putative ABC transport system permease protein [Granulicatella balaenopterae]
MFLALKEIKKERKKFSLMMMLVALISFLVFFLLGLAYGLAESNKTAIDQWKAKGILMSEEANGNIYASTVNYKTYLEYDELTAAPINVSRTVAYLKSDSVARKRMNVVFMGIDFSSILAPQLVAGTYPSNLNELVISQSLEKEQHISLGDTLLISHSGLEYSVVGIASSAKLSTQPVIYTSLEMASPQMLVREELQSALFINKEHPPTTISAIVFQEMPEEVKGEYNQLITIDAFIEALPGYLAQKLTFGMMISFLIGIAVIVLSIFMYIITIGKKEIYGIMKIQGISNSYISQSVILETFFVTVVGLVVGMIVAIVSGRLMPMSIPFEISIALYSLSAILIILMSILGAIFSVRSIMKIDPLDALR